jgi:hypothetical protein
MLRSAFLAAPLAVLVASCASAPPEGSQRAVVAIESAPSASASAAPGVPLALDVKARPSHDGAVLRVRVSELERLRTLVVGMLGGRDLEDFERELGLDRGLLGRSGGEAFSRLGIDPTGVVTVEAFELDERADAAVGRLRAAMAADEADRGGKFLDAYHASPRSGWLLTRASFPVTGDGLGDRIERALVERGGRRLPIASGEVAYTLGRAVWHVATAGPKLRVELALGDHVTDPHDVRDALGALAAWAESASSDLAPNEGASLRMRPAVVEASGLYLGAQRLAELDVGQALDADALRARAARIEDQAAALAGIDAPDGRPRYETVSFSLRGDTLSMTSTLAQGSPPLDKSDFVEDGAEFEVDGSTFRMGVNGAALYGWRILPTAPGVNPYYGRDVKRQMSHADFPAEVLLLGETPFLLARALMEGAEPIGQATLPFMRKWDRLGVAAVARPTRSAEEVFVGVLPAAATEENAACALSQKERGCAQTERIKPKGALSRGGFSITRRKIEGRWVVVASRDPALAKDAVVHVKVGPRPALAFAVDPAALAKDIGLSTGGALPSLRAAARRADDGRGYTATLSP